jgi:L-glyceraldehyde 3-phosphate reductase
VTGLRLEATGIAAGKDVTAAVDRYDRMEYRRAGRSGLVLPAISLGAWLTFGGYRDADAARDCFRAAFDLGITHFDFANNYGDPPGRAEIVCGEIIRRDLPRDELIISSKAGHRMWPGPYGEWCSKKALVASCEQSLRRLGLDYLDVFYLHRVDWETPFEEQLEALDLLIRQGKVLYGGVSSWSPQGLRAGEAFTRMQEVVEARGLAPITLHQPEYSLLRRGLEVELFPRLEAAGTGAVAFRTLVSGLLTDRYLGGVVPAGSRGAELWGAERTRAELDAAGVERLRALAALAAERGQTLAQLAIAWALRLPVVTTVLVGASTPEQLHENVAALERLDFSEGELRRIDELTA